jgi:hypothetical protein
MDAAAQSSDQGGNTTYTTSKQVQAWFLRRSRDRWKKKYGDLRGQLKRLRQRVADTDGSRTRWRRQAEDAAQQIEALQAEIARLRDATAAGGEKICPTCVG